MRIAEFKLFRYFQLDHNGALFLGTCCWNYLRELELLRVLVNECKPSRYLQLEHSGAILLFLDCVVVEVSGILLWFASGTWL